MTHVKETVVPLCSSSTQQGGGVCWEWSASDQQTVDLMFPECSPGLTSIWTGYTEKLEFFCVLYFVEIDTDYVVLCYLTNNILCGMRSLVSGFITLIIPWRQLDH